MECHLWKATPDSNRLLKCIIERSANSSFHLGLTVHRQRTTLTKTKRANIVETVDVINVIMRVNNRINRPNLFSQKLRAKIGSRVDKKRTAW
jgi:hypothetical protein